MADTKNVSQTKPKTGGAVSYAAVGTTLPTDAKAKLAEAFKNVGYLTEDGVVNSSSRDMADIKAWGGDVVVSAQTGKTDTFKFAMLEGLSVDVLKIANGENNVTGTFEAGITVKANSDELTSYSYVIDMILQGEALKRIVIPKGKITAVDDVTYKSDVPISYGVTITCLPDSQGNTHYEYVAGKTASTGSK